MRSMWDVLIMVLSKLSSANSKDVKRTVERNRRPGCQGLESMDVLKGNPFPAVSFT